MSTRRRSKGGDRLERQLERVRAVADGPIDDEAITELRALLELRANHVVARAAGVVRDHGLTGLRGELQAPLGWFSEDPVKRDPGCVAKLALLEALDLLDEPDPDVFTPWVAYRQMEPAWPRAVDTAMALRTRAARGLARLGHTSTLNVLADQLADPEPVVREAAAESVAYFGAVEGAALLRLKLRMSLGSEEPEVLEACLLALLALDPEGGCALGGELLLAEAQPVRTLTGLALGASRLEGTLELLIGWYQRSVLGDERRAALTSIGLLRSAQAVDRLLDEVRKGSDPDARAAIEALGVFAHDSAVATRVWAAAAQSAVELGEEMERVFGGNERT